MPKGRTSGKVTYRLGEGREVTSTKQERCLGEVLREIAKEKRLTSEQMRGDSFGESGFRNVLYRQADPAWTRVGEVASRIGVSLDELWARQTGKVSPWDGFAEKLAGVEHELEKERAARLAAEKEVSALRGEIIELLRGKRS